MIERQLDIQTPHGATTTFIVHPERDGPHPAIIFFMDAPAIREELRDMARRLASGGYYVMLPNLYYRAGVMEIGPLGDAAARERMFELMNGLTIDMVMSDTQALLDFIDQDAAAKKGPPGVSPIVSRPRPRSTAPSWSPSKPTARIGWRATLPANSISPAPRSTIGRRWRRSRR
jgi:carboxymethylenebutenolidase